MKFYRLYFFFVANAKKLFEATKLPIVFATYNGSESLIETLNRRRF